ncbi:MAG: DUF4384 domain-containing protein [Geminicoccaceae bacterium]
MRTVALLGWVAGFALAASTGAAEADMVVLDSTAPAILPGTIVVAEQELELPESAVITLMATDGSTTVLRAPGGTVPSVANDLPNHGLLSQLSTFVSANGETRIGAVRTVGCETNGSSAPGSRVTELISRGCYARANDLLDQIRAEAVVPSLFVGADKTVFQVGEEVEMTLMVNFDAFLYCALERADGETVTLFPNREQSHPVLNRSQPRSLHDILGWSSLVASPPTGSERLNCVASAEQLPLEAVATLSPSNKDAWIDGVRAKSADRASGHEPAIAVASLEFTVR